jgi:hypothetical protein
MVFISSLTQFSLSIIKSKNSQRKPKPYLLLVLICCLRVSFAECIERLLLTIIFVKCGSIEAHNGKRTFWLPFDTLVQSNCRRISQMNSWTSNCYRCQYLNLVCRFFFSLSEPVWNSVLKFLIRLKASKQWQIRSSCYAYFCNSFFAKLEYHKTLFFFVTRKL